MKAERYVYRLDCGDIHCGRKGLAEGARGHLPAARAREDRRAGDQPVPVPQPGLRPGACRACRHPAAPGAGQPGRHPRPAEVVMTRACQAAGAEDERGYRDQLAGLDGVTLPRARYLLAQQQATLRDTPYDRGVIRATAEYVRALEGPNGGGRS